MHALLSFIVVGLTTGSVYGLAGSGLALTYKTSGIFNFGFGAIGTVPVLLFYSMHVEHGLSIWICLPVCILGVGIVLGLAMELLARRLVDAPASLQVGGTVGLILIVEGMGYLWYGQSPRTFPNYFKQGYVSIGGVNINYQQLTIIIVGFVAVVALGLFFKFSRLGVAMRGVVDDPSLLAMNGTSPSLVRRTAWIVGSTFACAAGVLIAPSVNLDALVLTTLVIQSFGAAAIGRFTNIGVTYVGGLLLGVAMSVLTGELTSTNQLLQGLSPTMPYIVLFLVLIFTPRSKLTRVRFNPPRPIPVWRAPGRVQAVGLVVVLVVLATGPFWFGTRIITYTLALSYVMLLLSLGLLVRSSNQASLAVIAFAAIGAVVFSKAQNQWHLPWLVALVVAAVIAMPIGAIIAIPAIRVSGVFLALATLGFGLILENMFYSSNLMFGISLSGVDVKRPTFLNFDGDKGYYYLSLILVAVACALILTLGRTRLGRLLRGIGDSPMALATHGTSINVTRVLVFCISAALAAVGGVLLGGTFTNLGETQVPSFTSLTLFVIVLLAAGGEPWYALMGGFFFIVFPTYLPSSGKVNFILLIVFGVSMIQAGMLYGRQPGLPARFKAYVDHLGGRRSAEQRAEAARRLVAKEREEIAARAKDGEFEQVQATLRPGVTVNDLVVRFGGNVAVSHVSLKADIGTITGLIGPNGAGKTTTFNVCSGLLRPSAGTVSFKGADISRIAPAGRARLGLGRTFQRMQLFDSMSVEENVRLGREAALAGRNVLSQVFSGRASRVAVERAAREAMALCGVEEIARVQAGLLSTGQRRLVELARCLAGDFELLLLDEPSSGLDRVETEAFGKVLVDVVRERGIGILLVEHDMSLVMKVCSYLYVLDFGNLIFEGEANEAASSDVVRAAYLGAEDVTHAAAAPLETAVAE